MIPASVMSGSEMAAFIKSGGVKKT